MLWKTQPAVFHRSALGKSHGHSTESRHHDVCSRSC